MQKKRRTKGGPDPIDKHVGSRVRARRLGQRLSQTELGTAIGVTFQQIQKYENGTNRVGSSNLFRISQALGVDVGYFFEGVGAAGLADRDAEPFPIEDDPMASREGIELVHNFYRIDDGNIRRRISLLVRDLAGGNDDTDD